MRRSLMRKSYDALRVAMTEGEESEGEVRRAEEVAGAKAHRRLGLRAGPVQMVEAKLR